MIQDVVTVILSAVARVWPPEPASDALMHLFYAIGPPGELRRLVSLSNQGLT